VIISALKLRRGRRELVFGKLFLLGLKSPPLRGGGCNSNLDEATTS